MKAVLILAILAVAVFGQAMACSSAEGCTGASRQLLESRFFPSGASTSTSSLKVVAEVQFLKRRLLEHYSISTLRICLYILTHVVLQPSACRFHHPLRPYVHYRNSALLAPNLPISALQTIFLGSECLERLQR